MKRARNFVKKLSVENLTLDGLREISHEMDGFNEKERFEVLLLMYARSFLGIDDDEELPESVQVSRVSVSQAQSGLPAIMTTSREISSKPVSNYKSSLKRFFGK